MLGIAYHTGEGVDKVNYRKAAMYYELAEEQGDEVASKLLKFAEAEEPIPEEDDDDEGEGEDGGGEGGTDQTSGGKAGVNGGTGSYQDDTRNEL